MLSVIVVAVLLFLSMQTFPVAMGVDMKKSQLWGVVFVLLLAALQGGLFWIGFRLGQLFMHFMDGFQGVVLFLGFSLIGIRMLMEVFHIRKGERTYIVEKPGHIILAGLAQAMNTLLAGLLFTYITTNLPVYEILFGSSFVLATVGVWIPSSKINLSLASLFYLLGGLVMLIAGVYLAFFAV